MFAWAAMLGVMVATTSTVADEAPSNEPPLPTGLQVEEEPSLPAGLGASDPEEPTLPAGLGQEEPALPGGLRAPGEPALPGGLGSPMQGSTAPLQDDSPRWWQEWESAGFFELRNGTRLVGDPDEDTVQLGELRLQLAGARRWDGGAAQLTADFLYDPVLNDHAIDLETGQGFIDLRNAHLLFSPTDFIDLKVGRQVLTWGTGDFLFINDLFPKDWNAFLSGRDVEYLKAPSDVAKLVVASRWASVDLVFVPVFDSDRFPDRARLSSFEPTTGMLAGQSMPVRVQRPDRWFRDWEGAARIYGRLRSTEWALYGYTGYWKSPAGFDPNTAEATHPALNVYGASLRRPLLGGIAHVEAGYYDSRDDREGADPWVQNSELRVLGGLERDLAKNLTVGAQWSLTHLRDHAAYRRALPFGIPEVAADRHVVTLRINYLMLQQNLTLSAFGFWGVTDQEFYIRPRVTYRVDDHLRFDAGANVFGGKELHTMFAQFQNNTNAYAAIRYSW